jgi:predicted dehydrogenase
MARKATKSKPQFARTKQPLSLVVDYDSAFKALKAKLQGKRDIRVTFVDKSEYWRNDPNLAQKIQNIIASVKSWGADYLDKSDPGDVVKYEALQADVVIIATPDSTHAEVAEEWLKRVPCPEQIFIEKPLEASLNNARRLLEKIEPYDDSVLAFDHYRARLLPSRFQMDVLLGFLRKRLRRFTFYFLEDHSGGDPHYQRAVERDGPIENEQRVQALTQGVILDSMPHAIAILAHFGRVETVRVTRVRAGQYIGVDGDPNKCTEIEKETFAEVGFVFADHAGNPVEGTAYVGKGVRGVTALGPQYDYNIKLLEIEGLNRNKIRFDLRSSGEGASEAHLINRTGKTEFKFDLNRRPYETFLEKVADGSYLDDRLALNVEVGKRILEVLEDIRYPIPEKKNTPTYPCGMKNVRQSPYLENLLDGGQNALPILYGC